MNQNKKKDNFQGLEINKVSLHGAGHPGRQIPQPDARSQSSSMCSQKVINLVSTLMCVSSQTPLPQTNITDAIAFLVNIRDNNHLIPYNIQGILQIFNKYEGPFTEDVDSMRESEDLAGEEDIEDHVRPELLQEIFSNNQDYPTRKSSQKTEYRNQSAGHADRRSTYRASQSSRPSRKSSFKEHDGSPSLTASHLGLQDSDSEMSLSDTSERREKNYENSKQYLKKPTFMEKLKDNITLEDKNFKPPLVEKLKKAADP